MADAGARAQATIDSMHHAFLAEKEQRRVELTQAKLHVKQFASAAGADLETQRARLRAEVESAAQAIAASKSADATTFDAKLRTM